MTRLSLVGPYRPRRRPPWETWVLVAAGCLVVAAVATWFAT
jgi:hypothetical protein